ncbi:MAG: glycoside hydrolase family 95 protein [Prevotellaceae bacterium]|jgi:alpha-L-fucosidase 2|nr:glycoside hydrolase family 95 protein [Prevotellaceae bacterium]
MKHLSFCVLGATIALGACSTETQQQQQSLWYNQPASKWLEASPIGNGRLGAMLYGGVDTDLVALNEATLWSGQFDKDQEKPFGREKLAALRELFFAGKLSEGNDIAAEHLRGNYNSFGTHLPLGNLKLSFEHHPLGQVSGYRRTLDLGSAVGEVTYSVGGVSYRREYFASNPADVVVVRLSASKPKSITFSAALDLLRDAAVTAENGQLTFFGKVAFHMHGPGGVDFAGKVAVSADEGSLTAEGNTLSVKEATTVTIVVDVRTSYGGKDYMSLCDASVSKALAKGYEAMREEHVQDYSSLFSRTELHLGSSNADRLPTDVRIRQVKEGKTDAGLDALFFQYGRYLLIASSRANSPLPANLQGIWNDNHACHMGWTCDYHLDINTQQNYWLANVGNLPECHRPLFTYIKDLSVHGARTAQQVYGCRGWTAHTVANVWGYSAPSQSIAWGLFPTAGSWLASHLWRQYCYTQDKSFLANEAYPLLKGNATFLLDYMVEHPDSGYLMTGPSISPENGFKYNDRTFSASMSPTGDRQLAFEIFTACIKASETLGVDVAFADSLRTAMSKLPPMRIGKNGALQEWFEDYEEAQPNHRHTTHLMGLYPLSQISAEKTPHLAQAAEKTIENRLNAEGWEDTEWSRANMLCYYARLKNPQKAYENLNRLLVEFSRDNLFSVAPGGIAGAEWDIFEFDANEAAPAGIAEMLVQSFDGYIELLPALPEQWSTGYFRGLCVEGGAEVDLQWKRGVVQKAVVRASVSNEFAVKLPAPQSQRKVFVNNVKQILTPDKNGVAAVTLNAGDVLEIQ